MEPNSQKKDILKLNLGIVFFAYVSSELFWEFGPMEETKSEKRMQVGDAQKQ